MEYILFAVVIVLLAAITWRLFRPRQEKQVVDQELIKLSERVDTLMKFWSEESKGLRQEIREARKEEAASRETSTKNIFEQIKDVTGKFGEMKTELGKIGSDVKEVSSFQNIFKSPKLTGEWGELSLDYLLKQYFPHEGSYEEQHLFSSGEKVDFALTLPNGRILPIDSKFPQDLFSQFIKANDGPDKETIRKGLVARVKKDVDDISSKYILPNENTVDFAIMYIPAESLYYEIISKEDLNSYAWNKKVALASPNTFLLTVVIVLHWFKEADIGKSTDAILKKLQRISNDGEKLSEAFRKLGTHIANVKSSYDDAEKRVAFLTDRVGDVTGIIGNQENPTVSKNEQLL